MPLPDRPRPLPLKLIHGLIALSVAHQLIFSEWIDPPWDDDGGRWSGFLYTLHQGSGLLTATVILLFCAALYHYRRIRADKRYFPWLSAESRQRLRTELAGLLEALRRLSLPPATATSQVAGAIQGLGLLAVAYMSATGTAIWLLTPALPQWAENLAEVHEAGAILVWAYLAGHGGMALAHWLTDRQHSN